MSYSNYTGELETLESLRFSSVLNITHLMTQLDAVQFALQTQRSQALQLIAGLNSVSNIFANDSRYPDKDIEGHRAAFICLDINDWPAKFEQILSAVNYKQPDVAQTNKDMGTNPTNYQSASSTNSRQSATSPAHDDATKCITSISERDRFEKALKSFTTGVSDIKRQIRDATWTRRTFEHAFNLKWTTSNNNDQP